MTNLELRAVQMVNTVINEPGLKEHGDVVRRLAASIATLAREHAAKVIRESFYTQRDEKAPGVWLMCKHRDEDGHGLIEDSRLWPRHQQAKDTVEQFIKIAIPAAEEL